MILAPHCPHLPFPKHRFRFNDRRNRRRDNCSAGPIQVSATVILRCQVERPPFLSRIQLFPRHERRLSGAGNFEFEFFNLKFNLRLSFVELEFLSTAETVVKFGFKSDRSRLHLNLSSNLYARSRVQWLLEQ